MIFIGVDMIEIERIAQAVARFEDRFLKRVYTEQELNYCQRRYSSLAARWAAKEAASKALGTGVGLIRWQEIEVTGQPNRRPGLQLHGAALERAKHLNIATLALSLSHSKGHAIAFVIATVEM